MIYFDNAATTYPKPEQVYKKMDNFYRDYGVNAGRGSYSAAKKATNLIDQTRNKLGKLLKIPHKSSIVFTPSATYAINLTLQGLNWNIGDVIYYSPFEHNAVLRTIYYLQNKYNIKLKQIPIKEKS